MTSRPSFLVPRSAFFSSLSLAPLSLLPRPPLRHPPLQHPHRQRAGAEHLVVEGADVEPVAELLLRLLAQAEDRELADLVGEGLAGPGDVAVGLALDPGVGGARVVAEELHDLLARPVLVVDPPAPPEA